MTTIIRRDPPLSARANTAAHLEYHKWQRAYVLAKNLGKAPTATVQQPLLVAEGYDRLAFHARMFGF